MTRESNSRQWPNLSESEVQAVADDLARELTPVLKREKRVREKRVLRPNLAPAEVQAVADVETPDRILALMDEATELDRAGNRRAAMTARDELRELRWDLSHRLAQARGWIMAKTHFTVGQLQRGRHGRFRAADYVGRCGHPWVDHEEYFRWPVRPHRPAAILTHSYASPDELKRYAHDNRLSIELLPWSWYFPGRCTAALLRRQHHTRALARAEQELTA